MIGSLNIVVAASFPCNSQPFCSLLLLSLFISLILRFAIAALLCFLFLVSDEMNEGYLDCSTRKLDVFQILTKCCIPRVVSRCL